LKRSTLFIIAVTLSAAALAEDYVRDGRPCLSGICVGDELSTLSGIKWKVATGMIGDKPLKTLKYQDSAIKGLTGKFAPASAVAATAAAPYLLGAAFDGEAIPKLAKVTGFCEPLPLDLTGNFDSESGHATRVIVSAEPGADPASQSLRVKLIIRKFPQEYTSDQIRALAKQLKERYATAKSSTFADISVPSWKFDEFNRELWLMAPVGNPGQKRDRLKQYPGCGKSLKID
jgi:hypothetical protein